MGQYYEEILSKAWQSALASGSSTNISVFYLSGGAILLTFAITLLYEWTKGGTTLNSFKGVWKQWPTYLFPVISLALLWLALFGWSVVVTAYTMHTNLVTANAELARKNNGLQTKLDSIPPPLTPEQLTVIHRHARDEATRLFHVYQRQHSGNIDEAAEMQWVNASLREEGIPFVITSMSNQPAPLNVTGFKVDHNSGTLQITNPTVTVNNGSKQP